MPVLKNPKHERFAQELAKGKSQAEAYQLAGYEPSEPHASRLASNGKVRDRITELMHRGAIRAEITVQSLIEEAEQARLLAMTIQQPSAAIAAVREKGVLSGRRVERSEAGKPGDFDRMSDDELDALIATREGRISAGVQGTRAPSGQTGVRTKPSGLH